MGTVECGKWKVQNCRIAPIHPAKCTVRCALVAVVLWTHHENANSVVGHIWKRTLFPICKKWVVISVKCFLSKVEPIMHYYTFWIFQLFISMNKNFELLPWPPYSPNFNPCDYYLWGFLKHHIYSNHPQSITK
jgi:hypothetical protein